MSTITKERAQEIFLGNGPEPTASEERELARIALASLEAKPVAAAYVINGVIEADDFASYCGHPKFQDGPIELYANPPAPVSVLDITALDNLAGEMLTHAMNCERRVAVAYTHCAHRLAEEVRDLRAAMLQGADGNSPVIPDWQAKAEKLAELYGVSFVVFRNGESPQCADPSKVVISFTEEGLGHGAAAGGQ